MPYFSARGFVGSVIFHTPLGKWVTLEQNRLPVAASYREEERQRRLGPPAHAATSEGDSEMVYSLDKCQRVKSIFSALSFFTRGGKLRAGYVSTHPERSEMKHQTHCRVLVGSSFLWLPLDSWKGTVTCADLARRHLQRGGTTHKHPHTKLLGFKSSICKHAPHTYGWHHRRERSMCTSWHVEVTHNTETGSCTFMSLLPSWQVSVLIGPADPGVSCLLHSPWNRHDIVLI